MKERLTRDRVRNVQEDDRARQNGVQSGTRTEVDTTEDDDEDSGEKNSRDGDTVAVHDGENSGERKATITGKSVNHSRGRSHKTLGSKDHRNDGKYLQANRTSLGIGSLIHGLEQSTSGRRVDRFHIRDGEQKADEEDERARSTNADSEDHSLGSVDVR